MMLLDFQMYMNHQNQQILMNMPIQVESRPMKVYQNGRVSGYSLMVTIPKEYASAMGIKKKDYVITRLMEEETETVGKDGKKVKRVYCTIEKPLDDWLDNQQNKK